MPNKTSPKIAVPEELKREIAAVAGHEGRPEYQLVEDAWKLYKLIAIGKTPRKGKKTESVPVVDVISAH
jgi:hypothetical protein